MILGVTLCRVTRKRPPTSSPVHPVVPDAEPAWLGEVRQAVRIRPDLDDLESAGRDSLASRIEEPSFHDTPHVRQVGGRSPHASPILPNVPA